MAIKYSGAFLTDVDPTKTKSTTFMTNTDGHLKGAWVVDKNTGQVGWDPNARITLQTGGGDSQRYGNVTNLFSQYVSHQEDLARQYTTQYNKAQSEKAIADLNAQLAAQQAAALKVEPTPTPAPVTTPVKVEPTVKTPEPVAPVTPTTPAASLPVTQPVTPITTVTPTPSTQDITPVDVTGTVVAPVTATPAVAPITQTPAAVDQPRRTPDYYSGLGTAFDLNTLAPRVSGVEEYNTAVEELEGTNKRKRNQWTVSSQLGF